MLGNERGPEGTPADSAHASGRFRQLIRLTQSLGRVAAAYVRQTNNWGLFSVLHRSSVIVLRMLRHPVCGSRVARTLAYGKFVNLAIKHPILLLKFSWNVYANSLGVIDRATLFADHYEFLGRQFGPALLDKIVEGLKRKERVDGRRKK